MYELVVTSQFAAAHNLRNYGGKCESLHGHNWRVEVFVRADALGKGGMVLDFRILREEIEKVLEALDHQYLNDLPSFRQEEPSSENIARYIYDALDEQLRPYGVRPHKVTAWESEGAGASYLGGER
ncbi:MAG: 6-carboxytetrahydropterin synthase QueD [Deltaproteobacteria bacterium RBG_13_52_11]|nr:MAG: 6-carboxytetrahydropterin synthase QueD [Deltaproteobacteria bacterium RBG_13_52_11]